MNECPFCDVEKKFTHTYFSDVGETSCEAWIDYAKDNEDKLLWYAVLNGDQYTKGHTLFILASHRRRITDCSSTELELGALATGLNKVTNRLKDILHAETIHVLTLCEGVEHLHFHLIPRYAYTKEEKEFYVDHYYEKDRKNHESKTDYKKRMTDIHGMWYVAYHEMNFKNSEFYGKSLEIRVKELEDIAKCLRDRNLLYPFSR